MASFNDKMRVATAISGYTRQDLSSQHITSSDFFEFSVAKCLELVPNQKISIDMFTQARLAPMPVPTFGRARINNRAYFVPFRTVFPAWNDFITDANHSYSNGSSSLVSKVPTLSNHSFVAFLRSAINSTEILSDDITSDDVDFTVIASDGAHHYNFTRQGRISYKILRSLGYAFDFNLLHNDEDLSLLPLFCVAKVYIDWYYPSAYASDARLAAVEGWLKFDLPTFTTTFGVQALQDIMNVLVLVNYDSDYFVSAWENPSMPNAGASSTFALKDITNGSAGSYSRQIVSTPNDTSVGSDNAPVIAGTTNTGATYPSGFSNLGALSQYALNALRALTDYMKRHQLVGARALDRYLARFGINLPAERLNRSNYIGYHSQVVHFGDVTATADTSGANLGDYAGKGISADSCEFEFSATEYGCLVIISTIVPIVGYYQGQHRTTMHVTKGDFWTPEFDNLGVQAISAREVYLPLDGTKTTEAGEDYADSTSYSDVVFGFTPRYAEYKCAYDILSGDYVLNSRNAGKDSWHLFRNLDALFAGKDTSEIVHDVSFVRGVDNEQYARIFYNTDVKYNHFSIIHNFNITSMFPGKSLWDTYEFSDNDNPKVVEDVNGVKSN